MAPSITAVRPGLLLALAVLYTHATALALAAILKKMPGSQGRPRSAATACIYHCGLQTILEIYTEDVVVSFKPNANKAKFPTT